MLGQATAHALKAPTTLLSKSTTKRRMSGKIVTGRILVYLGKKTMRGHVHNKNDGAQGEGFRATVAVLRL